MRESVDPCRNDPEALRELEAIQRQSHRYYEALRLHMEEHGTEDPAEWIDP